MAKEKQEASTAIMTVDQSPYSVIARSDSKDLLSGALIDGGVGVFQLTQLRVPSGGGIAWTVDTLEGQRAIPGSEMEVIIGSMRGGLKKWWRANFGEGDTGQPDCQSVDGVIGLGENWLAPEDAEMDDNGRPVTVHNCATCPMNKWGSDRKGGKGKDCSDFMVLFVFRPGCSLPDVLNIPPSSLKTIQSYVVKLTNAGKTPWSVVTRLALDPKSEGKLKWSLINPQFVRDLTEQEAARFNEARSVLPAVMAKAYASPISSAS
jgi:hypothetical protein